MFRNKSPSKAPGATVTVPNCPFPPVKSLTQAGSISISTTDSTSANTNNANTNSQYTGNTNTNIANHIANITRSTINSDTKESTQSNARPDSHGRDGLKPAAIHQPAPPPSASPIVHPTSDNTSHTNNINKSVITQPNTNPNPSPGTGNSSSGSSSIASPSTIARRPTHRRGLSHGSFSLLNTSGGQQQQLNNKNNGNNSNNTDNSHHLSATSGSKSNTLTLGVPSSIASFGAYSSHLLPMHSTMHFTGQTSGQKANSSEFLSHADMADGLNTTSGSALHANPSGTSLVSQASQSDEIKRAIAHLGQKVTRTKDLIRKEQQTCDENVNEYLKLSAAAEPNQCSRLRTMFENNNKKSIQKINRLQKKLKGYDEKIKEIKDTGVYSRHTREKLKDGVNIITGISGGVIEGIKSGIHSAGETVIAKPKEFFKRSTNDSSAADQTLEGNVGYGDPSSTYPDLHAHHPPGLNPTDIRESALSPASIPGTGTSGLTGGPAAGLNHSGGGLNSANSHSTKCTSDDESSTSITSGSGQVASGGNHSFNNSAHLSSSPLKMKPLIGRNSVQNSGNSAGFEASVGLEIEALKAKLEERNEDCVRLASEMNCLKGQYQNDVGLLNQALQDEKYRVDRLEEQLNDLTELHQREIENLRQTITDLEEKMLYQTEERHRDVHEMLESFQTRISRMEHQQHQHLQQLVNLDSLENSNARALVLKLINVLLTVLQVVLLLVATLANILSPFLHTRARIFTSVIVILFFSFVFQHWPELTIWTKQKIYEKCLYVLSTLPFLSFDDTNAS